MTRSYTYTKTKTETRIGIVGGGTVGRAVARAWMEFVDEVRVYDVDPARATHTFAQVMDTSIVFICLPTPAKVAGRIDELDTSALDEFFVRLNTTDNIVRTGNFVLRSTLPLGTTDRLARQWHLSEFVYAPEFLTARCAEVDARVPAQHIIGVPFSQERGPGTAQVVNSAARNECCQMYVDMLGRRFPGINVQLVSAYEAELIKLGLNSIFATKVALFNELYQIATAFKMDWERVLAGILGDGRLTAHHTRVPGPDGQYGFGGTCLPKDLGCLIMQADRAGLNAWVMRSAYERNQYDRGGV